MKPRYYKYHLNKKYFDIYRITCDNKVQRLTRKGKGWRDCKDGHFARLHEEKMEEISEEDYFLEQI